MISSNTRDRGEAAIQAAKSEGERGRSMQVLTPVETAEVSGGFLLLYWLLVQPAY